ncbi:hypothetical protein C8J56DRAFT_1030297 [Mycena floridula]|nr:hypothetical protein C8J56DRAFT_1030297 [Mycena floridula]
MYINSSPEDVVKRLGVRKPPRTPTACSACRKRKIKCQVDRENFRKPCSRCAQLNLTCEYIAVAEDPSTSSSGPSEPSKRRDQSISSLPTNSTISYIYRPHSRADPALSQSISYPAYGASELSNSDNGGLSHSQQRVDGLGYSAIFPDQNHHPSFQSFPIPQPAVYDTRAMETFMASSHASSTMQHAAYNYDTEGFLQQMYHPSSPSQCSYCYNAPCICSNFGEL